MCDVFIKNHVPNKGRGLFAKKHFRKGESLFEEKPLVSAQFLWNALYKYLACDNCLKSLETAEQSCRRLSGNPSLVLPYPDCCDVHPEQHVRCPSCQIEYCSEACREEAWGKYHQVLCMGASSEDADHPLARLQDAWRNLHYPPETCSVMLIARMLATVKQAKNKDSVIASFGEFCKTTVNEEEEIMHKLLGKEFQEQLELLRSLTLSALPVEELQQWFSPEGFRSVFALVGTNGQGIGTSSLSVWVRNCESLDLSEEDRERIDNFIDQLYEDIDKVSGQFLNCEGSGLYSLQSTCNHSCVPNAEVTFPHDDHTLCVVALEDIPEGEEICICYLDECARERSRHSRQKILRENYLFNCLCTKCASQADDPDVTSEEEDEEDMEEEDG